MVQLENPRLNNLSKNWSTNILKTDCFVKDLNYMQKRNHKT